MTVVVAGALVYGASRWHKGTKALQARLVSARLPIAPVTYDPGELEGLPAPVQRYFRTVLTDGQPLVAVVRVAHAGQLNMSENPTKARWSPFTSEQLVITRRPGFDWDARVRLMPGIQVFVHDAYVVGEGILHATLFGLFPLANLRGTPEVAAGELMRFLAEAAWYPTAFLPSQGVRWAGLDDTSARATLTDGATTVALDFHFDAEGLIQTVRAAARYRTVHNTQVATPWQGRFWGYAVQDGMRVPLQSEVEWQLPEGSLPYWRGHITHIVYEFAR